MNSDDPSIPVEIGAALENLANEMDSLCDLMYAVTGLATQYSNATDSDSPYENQV